MKKLPLTLLLSIALFASGTAQKETFWEDLLSNKIAFPSNTLELSENIPQFTAKLPSKNESTFESQICADSSEIIVQIGDSLYGYKLETDQYNLLGKVIHGISCSFDVVSEPAPTLVTAATWDSVYLNNRTGWAYAMHHANHNYELIHTGAGHKTTYFMGGNLWFYNGVSNPVMIRSNIHYAAADLVVDEFERAWVLTGSNWPVADTLRIIDSTGHSLCDIPFKAPVGTYNAYGMFIKGGKVYVGFGGSHPIYHNTVVPLEFEDAQVHFGVPIPMNPDYDIDLGSCEKWVRYPDCNLVATQEASLISRVDVFPNPFSSELRIDFKQQPAIVTFFNAMGFEMAGLEGSAQGNLLTDSWPKGISYGIVRQNGIQVRAIKLVKVDF